MFESVLVANRAEIARRVIRTVRGMGLKAIAVYSEADADLPYVAEADEAVLIGHQGEERITAEDWADELGTIGYEIVCGIGDRVPRRHAGEQT